MAKITIDNKEYDPDALNEEARNNILNIRHCETRLSELRREMAMIQTARNAYAAALGTQLPKDA